MLAKPINLHSQTNIFYTEIVNQQYNFDRANIEASYLKNIKKEDILEFYKVKNNVKSLSK